MCPAIFYIKQSTIISSIPPNGVEIDRSNLLDRLLNRFYYWTDLIYLTTSR